MAYESPTSINASEGIQTIFYYINNVTDEWFARMIMLAIYVIVLMGYYKARSDFSGALAVAGWGTFVVGLLFWVGGLISGWVFSIVIGVAILGVVFVLIDTNSQN
jgi:hypothetical protein